MHIPSRTAGRRISARPAGLVALSLLPGLGLLLGGCLTPQEHREEADREVYAILEERRAALFGDGAGFTIEPPEDSLRARLLSGASGEVVGLDLVESLEIASENSREYRRQREALYLAALDLTLERWRFTIQENGSLGAQFARLGSNTDELSADGGATLTRLLGSGALIVGDVGLGIFRNLASGDDWDVVSNVGLSITQPLLRGYGREIVEEPLTQAERDVVYEVRSYERFRRSFAVDVATQLYRILQQADVVTNERANIEDLKLLRERNEELAAAGRLSDIQVDQARQNELRSRDRLISQEQRYESLLDNFKLFLGLPIQSPLTCDPAELERLEQALDFTFDRPEEELVELALAERLDYRTTLDQVADAERAVRITEDALRTGLDLNVDVNLRSEEGRPLELSRDDSTLGVGLDMDLPVDRLPQRNAYRAAQIALQVAQRAAEEEADLIRTALRARLRDAVASRETFEIQRGAVMLAERRVESARLRLDAGRADTRDILEAQQDLVDAQNAATAALIDHRLAQLALFRDLEVLRVDETGVSVDRALLASSLDEGT